MARKPALLLVLLSSSLILTGCFQPWTTEDPNDEYSTGNQGGSNTISLLLKLGELQGGSKDLSDFNPDDFQVLVTLTGDVIGEEILITDNVAQALVDVIDANDIGDLNNLPTPEEFNEQDFVVPDSVTDEVIEELEQLFQDLQDANLENLAETLLGAGLA
jgi:hypothetical protein